MRFSLSVFLFLFLINTGLQAQECLKAHRIIHDVDFDGIPDEDAWHGSSPLPLWMLQPNPGDSPTERTEILVSYTENYLWIGGRFFDENPELIRANTKKRDDFGDDSDFFGIMIDGLNTKETGFIFCTTPLATRLDFMIYNDGRDQMPFNMSWNTFWDVKTAVTDEGWFMGQVPWNLTLSLHYTSNRFNPDDFSETFWLNTSIDASITRQWQVSYNTRIDLIEHKVVSAGLTIYRDMHCWEGRLTWNPLGIGQGFFLKINIKSAQLRDIKVEKKQGQGTFMGF